MSAPIAMPTRRWGDEPKPAAPAPIVLVSSRDNAPVPRVTGAVRLVRAAEDSGWTARQTYALADVPAGWSGRRYPYRLASVAVLLSGPKGRGWAVWYRIDEQPWRFGEAWLRRAGEFIPRQLGARALMTEVGNG